MQTLATAAAQQATGCKTHLTCTYTSMRHVLARLYTWPGPNRLTAQGSGIVTSRLRASIYRYLAPGSGVWYNVGQTAVFRDHKEAFEGLPGGHHVRAVACCCLFVHECVHLCAAWTAQQRTAIPRLITSACMAGHLQP